MKLFQYAKRFKRNLCNNSSRKNKNPFVTRTDVSFDELENVPNRWKNRVLFLTRLHLPSILLTRQFVSYYFVFIVQNKSCNIILHFYYTLTILVPFPKKFQRWDRSLARLPLEKFLFKKVTSEIDQKFETTNSCLRYSNPVRKYPFLEKDFPKAWTNDGVSSRSHLNKNFSSGKSRVRTIVK